MTVLITDVVRSPEVQFTLEKCFPGAVQKINRGLVSQSFSVILDFGRRAIATLVFGTWGAVQAIGACMIVVVDLLGPSKYSILDAIQTMKYTVNKNDLTVERTRRISLELLEGDPIIRAAYAQGWEDRTEDTHLNIQAWNPSPTRSLNIFTPPTERLSIADEQTGCKITPVEKKLGLTTTSAQIAAPPTRKPTGDQHSLAKKRGKAIQQTGDGIGDQISIIVWSCPTLKKLPNTTMISYNEFLWANNLVQFDEATLQVSQLYRIVEIPRSVLPNASFDGFVFSGIQSLVNSKVQWEYLTCLFGETVHGGHITEDWARKLCLTHLKVNVNPDEPMKKFPVDPLRFHPTMLLDQLNPGMEPQYTILSRLPSIIHVRCIINGIEYCGRGLSRAKAEIIAQTFKDADIIALQETHVPDDKTNRLKINGFQLINFSGHPKHGIATYVNHKWPPRLVKCVEGNEHSIGIQIGDLSVFNVYKPPSERWTTQVLPVSHHPSIFIGDFNSHSTDWGYSHTDENGEKLSNWESINHMYLKYDAKQGGTFMSGRWGTSTSPDLCFVSMGPTGRPLSVNRRIGKQFPKSQHKTVAIDVGINLPRVNNPELQRWNIRKANWSAYSKYVEDNINRIEPLPENYYRFVKLIKSAACKSIPRGHRKNYIPCWNKECEDLLKEYEVDGSEVSANRLLRSLDEERRKRWHTAMQDLDFTHSSRESWALLRKLGAAQPAHKENCVRANAVSSALFKVSNIKPSKKEKIKIKKLYKEEFDKAEEKSEMSRDVKLDEIDLALKNIKNRKAAGEDGILPEFIKNLGPKGRTWLTKLSTSVLNTCKIPNEWHKSKVIAILKPNKAGDNPKNYRPISLLSVVYKVFERLVLNRIINKLESIMPKEQAGFLRGRSCSEQVLAITTHVENGFQQKLKSGAVFLDLSSAYDSVWKNGLLFKLAKVINCKTLLRLFERLLSDRSFKVHLDGEISKKKVLQNGLPQGSILSPVLFNVYTADIVKTNSRKFIYADDICIVKQGKTFEEIENNLGKDLAKIQKYLKTWHLILNASKSAAIAFHLNNREANYKIKINVNGEFIPNEDSPRYLGVKLDRALTFKPHLEGLKNKLKTRNNIISKLAGTTWGCKANTLHASAMALVYSAAEYCAPAWTRSTHSKKIDIQLNHTMRIISGTVKSTQIQWLPVLAHIAPPDLRRKAATHSLLNKIKQNPNLPVYEDIYQHPVKRLKSRSPVWIELGTEGTTEDKWKSRWKDAEVKNAELVVDPTQKLPGFDFPRALWTATNRIRTANGRCNHLLHKWGMSESPLCGCGDIQTTRHIVETCPLTKFDGGLRGIHEGGENAIEWLENLDIRL
ncbi:hypothetical protein QTP88_023687 [Uroleucon formosanum]